MKLMTVLSGLALACVIAGCASTQKTNSRTSVGEMSPDCEGMKMEDCGGCSEEGKKADEANPGAIGEKKEDCGGCAEEGKKADEVSPGVVAEKKDDCGGCDEKE